MFRWQIATGAGLGAAIVLGLVAVIVESGRIEADVAERAEAALEGEATSWATVEVSGRDVRLVGAAPAEDLRRLAATRVDRVFGVRAVDASSTSLLPEASPYKVTLSREGDLLVVAGSAPSAPQKERILKRIASAVPGAELKDGLQLARGMPDERFLDTLYSLAPAAADLSSGTVVLEDRGARIDGIAASNSAYDGLRTFAPTLPDGYSLSAPVLRRPVASPFSISAVLDEGTVTLSGYSPDADTRERLRKAAAAGRQGAVIETVDLASGDPPGFATAAESAFDFLDLFASARIDLVDDHISLTGVAASPEAWRTLNSHLEAFKPSGYVVEADIGLPVVSPYTLSATISGGKVTVTGFAPDAQTVDDIRNAAELVAAPGGVVVETTPANGAPDHFADAAAFAVRLLQHVEDGTVTLADVRISLAGKATTSGDLLEIEAAVALETPEGFTVDTAVQPPVVSPYRWSIERTEDSVVVTGHVPSEAVRVAVRDAADDAIGDLAVTDRTGLAGGLPDGIDLAAVAGFAAAEVALLDEGRVDLVDRTLSVTGRTADALAGRSARETFENRLPVGLERGTVDIEAPSPFRLHIEREPGVLIVEGNVPDDAARDRLFATVERIFGSVDLEMTLEPLTGLPDGAEKAVDTALRAAALLASGHVDISGTEVEIEGTALTRPSVEAIDTDLVAALPPGFKARTEVSRPEPSPDLDAAACGRELADVTNRVQPVFTDQGDLSSDADGALAELAHVALACRGLTLEIVAGGSVDGEKRAGLVAAALAAAGVAPERVRTSTDPASEGIRVVVVQPPRAPDAASPEGAGPPDGGIGAPGSGEGPEPEPDGGTPSDPGEGTLPPTPSR